MTTRAFIMAASLAITTPAAAECGIPANAPQIAPDISGPVTAVVDGDTLDVRAHGKTVRIRLYGVDAPEHQNTAGLLARAALERIADGKDVTCQVMAKDRYKRTVAACRIAEGPDLSLAQLATGNAATYRRYLKAEPFRAAYIAAEDKARAAHCGIWR
jgi:endonuclease YncB( thermonuclease family)